MTKHLLLATGILLGMVSAVTAQTYTMKMKVSSTETMELLEEIKKLFDAGTNISYSITTSDPEASFEDMSVPEAYDDGYLNRNLQAVKADSTNAICLNNLGNYYNSKGEPAKAKVYFEKAMRHLSVKQCNNDSAFYYSMRGVLKLNLGLDNATTDIERALAINPNDSIATGFYPIFLMNNRDFKKASEYCSRMLDKPGPYPHIPYVFLLSSDLLSSFFEKAAEAGDDKVREKYTATDFNRLFDYSRLDKYAALYKDSIKVQHLRMLADVFSLTVKLIFFKDMDKPNPVFTYTPAEKKRLAELEAKLTSPGMVTSLNPYTRTKALAFIYFMQQQKEKAISFFNEAVRIFPADKRNEYFNAADAYDALAGLYFLSRDTANERKTFLNKINAMPLGKKDAGDYYAMSVSYFTAGDDRNAKNWAEKAMQADSSHFNTLRLLSHLSYLDANPAVETYAQEASKYIRSGDDQYSLVMQFAIYQLITGDAAAAYNNITIGRQSLEGTPCELCDKLVSRYITVSE